MCVCLSSQDSTNPTTSMAERRVAYVVSEPLVKVHKLHYGVSYAKTDEKSGGILAAIQSWTVLPGPFSSKRARILSSQYSTKPESNSTGTCHS